VSDAKARQQLGYAPRVSRREGLAGVAHARGGELPERALGAWADDRGDARNKQE